jgi:hypothetical protein
VTWNLVYSKYALKDAKKLSAAGLRDKAQALLDILQIDLLQNPPPKNGGFFFLPLGAVGCILGYRARCGASVQRVGTICHPPVISPPCLPCIILHQIMNILCTTAH